MLKKKKWGIEYGISEGSFKAPVYRWHPWREYVSQRRMLQALSDLRKERFLFKKHSVNRNGDIINSVELFFHYRPVHINYGSKFE